MRGEARGSPRAERIGVRNEGRRVVSLRAEDKKPNAGGSGEVSRLGPRALVSEMPSAPTWGAQGLSRPLGEAPTQPAGCCHAPRDAQAAPGPPGSSSGQTRGGLGECL